MYCPTHGYGSKALQLPVVHHTTRETVTGALTRSPPPQPEAVARHVAEWASTADQTLQLRAVVRSGYRHHAWGRGEEGRCQRLAGGPAHLSTRKASARPAREKADLPRSSLGAHTESTSGTRLTSSSVPATWTPDHARAHTIDSDCQQAIVVRKRKTQVHMCPGCGTSYTAAHTAARRGASGPAKRQHRQPTGTLLGVLAQHGGPDDARACAWAGLAHARGAARRPWPAAGAVRSSVRSGLVLWHGRAAAVSERVAV